MRRAASLIITASLLGACVLTERMPSPASPAPSPLPSLEPTVVPSPTEVAPTQIPEPGLAQVPRLTPGSQALTNAPGLRVRSRPGTDQRVITSLGVDAGLLIGMGPVFIDGNGWYQVRDADAADPAFGEGWVAAGFEPDPFLVPASLGPMENPYLAGFAHDASGEYGPVFLADEQVSLRWIAAALDADGCSFAVDLRPGAGDPVPAVRTTVGSHPAPGELFSQYFAAHPELRGDLFVTVTSDCSWALSFVRPLAPTPSPAPSG